MKFNLMIGIIGGVLLSQPLNAQEKEGEKKPSAPIEVTADEVRCRTDMSLCQAIGKARVQQGDMTLHAQTIDVHARKDAHGKQELFKVEANGDVEMTTAQDSARGNRAEYLKDGNYVILFGSPAYVITPEHHLEADQVQTFLEEGPDKKTSVSHAQATGNVVMTTKDGQIRGSWANYDAREQRAVVTGGVVLNKKENFARGERATVNLVTGESVLSGETLKDGKPLQGSAGNRVRVVLFPETLDTSKPKRSNAAVNP